MNPTNWYSEVGDRIDDGKTEEGEGPNGAVAICIAALKVLAKEPAEPQRSQSDIVF